METKLGQEPAFASNAKFSGEENITQEGMSKRFYAACSALIGIIANNTFLGDCDNQVKEAYKYADELLKQEFE